MQGFTASEIFSMSRVQPTLVATRPDPALVGPARQSLRPWRRRRHVEIIGVLDTPRPDRLLLYTRQGVLQGLRLNEWLRRADANLTVADPRITPAEIKAAAQAIWPDVQVYRLQLLD